MHAFLFYPFPREWSQKALEEEQKKKEDEKRKKEEEKLKKKQQQQLQQQLHHQGGAKSSENVTYVKGSEMTSDSPAGKVLNLKKNFASLDCGAKVVSANPESQGAGNIISPARYQFKIN